MDQRFVRMYTSGGNIGNLAHVGMKEDTEGQNVLFSSSPSGTESNDGLTLTTEIKDNVHNLGGPWNLIPIS